VLPLSPEPTLCLHWALPPPPLSAGCSIYSIDAGPDIVVGTDPATGKATTDITLTLGGYTASDITTNNVNCTLKTGTTWTCRNLVAGDTVVTFAGNKAGEGVREVACPVLTTNRAQRAGLAFQARRLCWLVLRCLARPHITCSRV
jgi:hypothetical protein